MAIGPMEALMVHFAIIGVGLDYWAGGGILAHFAKKRNREKEDPSGSTRTGRLNRTKQVNRKGHQ